jgi:hypothetical protein
MPRAERCMRPSTALRLERRAVLLAAFARSELFQADVAVLLNCSVSGARNYMNALLAERTIAVSAGSRHQRCFAKQAFCLVRETWRDEGDRARAAPAATRRDPLVAALFGSR